MSGIKGKSGNTKPGKSGYYGVTELPNSSGFVCQIRLGPKVKNIGCYSNKEDAARAYDREAKRAGKKLLNFPGRFSQCSCGSLAHSDKKLAFFKKTDGEYDEFYCGCRGWD